MGEVFEAFDRAHGARVALKVLSTLTPEGLLRFKNEFPALQDFQHANVVSLGELLEQDGQWFFTMEYVGGGDFLEYVRARRSPPSEDPTQRVERGKEAGSTRAAGPRPAAAPRYDEPRL